jgi:hypothetical protein
MVAAGEPMDAAVAREVISRIDGMLKEMLELATMAALARVTHNGVALLSCAISRTGPGYAAQPQSILGNGGSGRADGRGCRS